MPEKFKHRFSAVVDYLHHRDPYLMVDAIRTIDDNRIITEMTVTDDRVAGHFPGAPIFPGAKMQEVTTQSAGILIAANHNPMEEFNTHDPFFNEFALGVLVKVGHSRFRGFARPGEQLIATVCLISVENQIFEFKGEIREGDRCIMRNHFWLANIPSSTLQGM